MNEYKIGTKYTPKGKNYVCTVTDILKTYNSKIQLVRIRYVSSHEFMGQTVTEYDVCGVTIARGLLQEGNP
jgi:hypothetical protein